MNTQIRLTTFISSEYIPTCPSCKEWVVPEFSKGSCKTRYIHVKLYEDGAWVRDEGWHRECYEKAENPYGDPGVYVVPAAITKKKRTDAIYY